MARIRSLKPGFFTNEHLAELPFEGRLCFAGLWTLADRDGRLEDRPRRIKAALFPYDAIDVDQLLAGLETKGFIVRYTADGVAYIAIPTFAEHQRPKTDEVASRIPAPLSDDPRGKETAPRPYKGQRGTYNGQRTEGEGADGAPTAADGAGLFLQAADGVASLDVCGQFKTLWNTRTSAPIPGCRDITTKRRRHIKARLTERALTDWEGIFARIQASAFCRGDNDRGWVASFDWVIGSPDVAVKVLEGKYDDRRKPTPVSGLSRCTHTPPCHDRGAHQRLIDAEATGEGDLIQSVKNLNAKKAAG